MFQKTKERCEDWAAGRMKEGVGKEMLISWGWDTKDSFEWYLHDVTE